MRNGNTAMNFEDKRLTDKWKKNKERFNGIFMQDKGISIKQFKEYAD